LARPLARVDATHVQIFLAVTFVQGASGARTRMGAMLSVHVQRRIRAECRAAAAAAAAAAGAVPVPRRAIHLGVWFIPW